ncbi:MAG: hypothetical protein IPK80_29940 [Nannocystis sp.]|jgi:hypothetical protein|nr:hypothetical protein [Nannocystis sp.]
MTTLAIIALFCCIAPALAVSVGGIVDVARSHALNREIVRAFAVRSKPASSDSSC